MTLVPHAYIVVLRKVLRNKFDPLVISSISLHDIKVKITEKISVRDCQVVL
jgi:hypothetical protein